MTRIVEGVRSVFSRDEGDGQSQADEARTTRLYRCESCNTTYVSEDMDTCPTCSTPVETTPTEQDLDLL